MPFCSYNVLMYFISNKRNTVEVQTVLIASRRTCKYQAPRPSTDREPAKGGARGVRKMSPWKSVDLHRSKPLISLVPFNLYFHCFQGQGYCYVTIPIVFPANQKQSFKKVRDRPWKSVMRPSCQYDVMSRVSDFQNSEQKCSPKRQIKIGDFSRIYCYNSIDQAMLGFLLSQKPVFSAFFK